MIFEDVTIKTIRERLNNSDIQNKDPEFTLKDLKRTSIVMLSIQTPNRYASEHTKSWWADYSPLKFDYTRYLLGMERQGKTKVFSFPCGEIIEREVFPFFNDNPVLKTYIMNQANQHNFACAARTAVMEQIFSAGFIFEGSSTGKTILEFRKNTDGSVSVFEKFYLTNSVMHLENENTLKSQSKHTVCVLMRSCIMEKDGEINHEVEYFSMKSIDKEFSDKLFSHPVLASLRKYLDRDDDMELGIKMTEEDTKEGIEEDKDWWMLIDGINPMHSIGQLKEEGRQKEFSEKLYTDKLNDDEKVGNDKPSFPKKPRF